ncbi:MAG TPA: SDR family NAD(P)-dependent oxidoreductase [Planctomycetes bacterium]|nr:SDR family NAD(P)-dependent oxidoreductase [Planctomycetota bacterium]HIK59986.1 SDR family NAD(P)-dependent oxidoreductase [Planctomycetota bacterium]
MKLTNNPLALVTGASAGIGAASARALHAAGAQVLLAARRTDRLQALAEELPGSETVQLDVRDFSAVQAALQDRAIDIAVLNAGLARGAGALQEGDPADWDEMLDTNVKGVLHCARAVLPGMLERGVGDMVLLGSVAGRQVYPGGNVYNASKFAVHALYQALRLDAGGRGVRFTTLDPGMVETEFAKVRYRGDEAQAEAVYAGMQPLTPEDVADALVYAVTRPAHVNVGEIVLWPTCQSSTRDVART